MLGYPSAPSLGDWDRVLEPPTPGQALSDLRPLFPRPEKASAHPTEAARLPSATASGAPVLAARAGVVRKVSDHPSADKLYILEIDVGEKTPRTVVAGLKSSYAPDSLLGHPVTLLANLAPRTIRRMTSQGMVLAADDNDRAILVEPPSGVAPGTYLEGTGPTDRTIAYDEFAALTLRVGRVAGPGAGGGSQVDLGARVVTVPGDWPPGARVVVRLPDPQGSVGQLLTFGPGRSARVPENAPLGAKVR